MYEGQTRGGAPMKESLDFQSALKIAQPSISSPEASADAVKKSPITSQWNTSKLGMRTGADAASAATAAGLIAPLICSIDRAIISKVATGASLSSCLVIALREPLLRPHKFIISKPFFLIFSIYFSTYFTANTVDTLTTTFDPKPESTFSSVTAGPAKFAATSAVNMTLSVVKDSQFARMFGQTGSGPAATIPKVTYALFMFRDSLTIFASFNLPPLIAPQLQNLPPAVKSKFSRFLSTESGRANTAQFLTPAAMQIFSTPVHLLGLDLFNRQGNLGFAARTGRVVRDWGVAATARMGRIIPAFGVGGVVNASMRRDLMHKLEGQKMEL